MKCPYCEGDTVEFNKLYNVFYCTRCQFVFSKEDKNLEDLAYKHFQELRYEYEEVHNYSLNLKKIIDLASDKIKAKALAKEI